MGGTRTGACAPEQAPSPMFGSFLRPAFAQTSLLEFLKKFPYNVHNEYRQTMIVLCNWVYRQISACIGLHGIGLVGISGQVTVQKFLGGIHSRGMDQRDMRCKTFAKGAMYYSYEYGVHVTGHRSEPSQRLHPLQRHSQGDLHRKPIGWGLSIFSAAGQGVGHDTLLLVVGRARRRNWGSSLIP